MPCVIIKNDGIGDLILSSGLIASIGEHFGGDVDLITCSANQEIAEGIEPLRNRFYLSRDNLRFSGRLSNYGLLLPRVTGQDQAVIRELSKRKYDIAICLRRFIRQNSLVIMRKVKAKEKHCAWQFPTNISRELAVKASRGWLHYDGAGSVLSELSYYAEFTERILGGRLDTRPCLRFCRQSEQDQQIGTIALGLSGASTNWPDDYWLELVGLLADSGWSIKLLGGSDVMGLAERIEKQHSTVMNLVGQLDWHATADALQDCVAYIGNDTGLSHFASLIVKKCLIVLGGGTFRRFFPWPDNMNQHLIYHGLECFDCDWQCKFDARRCLALVTPRSVYQCFEEMVLGLRVKETNLNSMDAAYPVSWRRRSVSAQASVSGRIID